MSLKALDDPSIDARSRTGKLVMGILALIAEFENDTRRERQMDGIAKAKDRGVKFGRKRELTGDIRTLRVGLLCNGSHTLSFSKVTPPRASDGTHYADCLRWDPLRRLVQCSIDACLAESCPLDNGGNRLASLALLTSTLGECFFGWTVKRLLLRLFFVPFSFSNSVNGTRTKALSWSSSRNLSVNLGTSGSSICASLGSSSRRAFQTASLGVVFCFIFTTKRLCAARALSSTGPQFSASLVA